LILGYLIDLGTESHPKLLIQSSFYQIKLKSDNSISSVDHNQNDTHENLTLAILTLEKSKVANTKIVKNI